jgi:integrase
MERLYRENMSDRHCVSKEDQADPRPVKRKRGDDNGNHSNTTTWAASHTLRVMLTFMYIVAFLCLLRSDEVLHLQWKMITLEDNPRDPGRKRLRLELPFRKTHQLGGQ